MEGALCFQSSNVLAARVPVWRRRFSPHTGVSRLLVGELDRDFRVPFRLVRLSIRRSDERFVARTEGVAVGIVPAIPFDAVILRPIDQHFVAFPAFRHIRIDQRRMSACGEDASGNAAITLHRLGDGDTQLYIHLRLHINDVIADKGRARWSDASLPQPSEHFVKRLWNNGGQFRRGRLRANADVGLFVAIFYLGFGYFIHVSRSLLRDFAAIWGALSSGGACLIGRAVAARVEGDGIAESAGGDAAIARALVIQIILGDLARRFQ